MSSTILILIGLVLLFVGGEALVRGSVSLARKFNVSELIIGLTLVGFGTSAPELVTSLKAISNGSVGIAVGNVMGSNIANIFFILGLAALIRPITTNPEGLTRDFAVMLAATALFVFLLQFDGFTRIAGILMVLSLVVYVVSTIAHDRKHRDAAADLHTAEGEQISTSYSVPVSLLMAVAGLAALIFGAGYLVDGATELARNAGISETLIGLTIVAVGTSLPELATSLIAAIRGRSDIAIGNIIGSNTFNILGILGIATAYKPFSVYGDVSAGAMSNAGQTNLFTSTDVGAMVLAAFLLILFALTGRQLARWEGAVLLVAYGLYIGMISGLMPAVQILPT
jgi:cation:H+ antiporter